MTAPIQAAEDQATELAAIEAAAHTAAAGNLARQLDALARMSAGAAAVSPDAWQTVLARLRAIFDGLPERTQAAVDKALGKAWAVGLDHAAASVGLDPLNLDLPGGLFQPVANVVVEQATAATTMLTSNEQIVPSIEAARRAIPRVQAGITWQVNRAASEAVTATASELGLARRWVAERDACLVCLSFQGATAPVGAPFAPAQPFAAKPAGVLTNPPAHPHCRCGIQLHDPADHAVVDALKREARRSVLKGWSLPSESESERLRAADRLLRAGAGLPQTVETAAERAVRRGAFRSRTVPTGR